VNGKLEIRLIRDDEIELWESYIGEYHSLFLSKKSLPGEIPRYVAILGGIREGFLLTFCSL